MQDKHPLGVMMFFAMILSLLPACSKDNAAAVGAAPQPDTFTNKAGLVMLKVPSGSFEMGAGTEDFPKKLVMAPPRTVMITKAFFLSATEVTNSAFMVFVNETGYTAEGTGASDFLRGMKDAVYTSTHSSPDIPVTCVRFRDAVAFCDWLSKKEKRQYRLPSVEEWEYACRAGATGKFCFGEDERTLPAYAWYKPNGEDCPHAVGQKLPNSFGFYDMHGNVWELCNSVVPAWLVREAGLPKEEHVNVRGGAFFNTEEACRCGSSWATNPKSKADPTVGFRIASD